MEREGPFWDFVAGRAEAPPAARTLGWHLEEVDPAAGTIRVAFEAAPEFRNPMGNIQGGFLAAMLDDTLGPALVATLEPTQFAPTLELKVSFLRPARPGRLVGYDQTVPRSYALRPAQVAGRVVHRGGTIAFLEGDLRDHEGKVIATATATARIVRTA